MPKVPSDISETARPTMLSRVLTVGDIVYISGTTARAADGSVVPGIEGQTRHILDSIKAQLEGIDLTMDALVSVMVHLRNADDFATFNEIYQSYFKPPLPTRTTVRCDLINPSALIEITSVANKQAV